MDSFFSVFQLLIGAYLLYCGVFGKGMIYKNENIKKGMEELYHKRMRVLSLIIGPLMLLTGLVDYFLIDSPYYMHFFFTLWGLTVCAITVLMVLSFKMTDRKNIVNTKPKSSVPHSAFEFDDDDDK